MDFGIALNTTRVHHENENEKQTKAAKNNNDVHIRTQADSFSHPTNGEWEKHFILLIAECN